MQVQQAEGKDVFAIRREGLLPPARPPVSQLAQGFRSFAWDKPCIGARDEHDGCRTLAEPRRACNRLNPALVAANEVCHRRDGRDMNASRAEGFEQLLIRGRSRLDDELKIGSLTQAQALRPCLPWSQSLRIKSARVFDSDDNRISSRADWAWCG